MQQSVEEQLKGLSTDLEQAQTSLNILQDEHNALIATHSDDTDLLRGLREELADRRASRDGFALQRDELLAAQDNLRQEHDNLAQKKQQLEMQLQNSQAEAAAEIEGLQQQCLGLKVGHSQDQQ